MSLACGISPARSLTSVLKARLPWFALLAVACSFSPLALAASAASPGVLRIGTPGDYAPYSWRDTATGHLLGSDIALARALASRLGLRAEFVPTTWATLSADAEAGRFDIAVGGISITNDRLRIAPFSNAITSDRKQPVVRCGEQARYNSRAEINRPQVRLIVNRGGTNERFAREHFPAASLTVHADNRTVFDEIRAGRADVMVTDAVEGRLQQRAEQGLCVAPVRANWAPASKAVWITGVAPRHELAQALARSSGARGYRRSLLEWEDYRWSDTAAPAMQLAALIDERLAIVTEVARAKWNTQAAIEDPPREQALLQSLRERAIPLQVSAAMVDEFFGAQIEAAKMLQQQLFAQWRRERRGKFADTADLARDIRPEIDRVTERMLEQLARLPGKNSRLPAASTMSMVSPAALKAARAPL